VQDVVGQAREQSTSGSLQAVLEMRSGCGMSRKGTGTMTTERYQIAVVLHALDILDLLAQSREPLGAAEVASRLNMPRNAAFRLLVTLGARGYVHQDEETRKYRLGFQLLRLGNAVQESRDIARLARPLLTSLRNHYEETVNLALLEGNQVLYIERIESPRSLRTSTATGTRAALHATSLGKAILAFSTAEQVHAWLGDGPLPAVTEHTVTARTKLMAHLEAIRKRGYALDLEESVIGVCCIGAPVFDAHDRPFAALSLSGPAHRMRAYLAQGDIARDVLSSAKELSRLLGSAACPLYLIPE